jgi:hypothetical protein
LDYTKIKNFGTVSSAPRNLKESQMWYMHIIPALRRLRQEDLEFEISWDT